MFDHEKLSPVEYEIFVQEFHQKLLEHQGFSEIDVRHNEIVIGKSGNKNQIDVYWELPIAGLVQKFCVECKKWKSKVKKSDVASFITILNDVGNARGIYVTTAGFQSGAVKLAEEHGVILIHAEPVIERHPARLEISVPKLSHLNIEFNWDNDEDKLKRIEKYIYKQKNEFPSLYDAMGVEIVNSAEASDFFERESDGYYEVDLSEYYIKVGNELINCKVARYYFYLKRFPQLGLDGFSESAKILAKYLSENKEVKYSMDCYNDMPPVF
ncbi:restriction endonuclease [Vibrio harveyi]|uniref:restriction endonuclease n=1 Tax=Vibrio harveyi TaxID=669 RepID=UPI00165DEFEF|nr:restriction endonuclease [Vibrio harveyi]